MHLTTTWRLASAGAAFVLLAACAEPEETAPIYEVAGVSRANISVSVEQRAYPIFVAVILEVYG